MHTGRNEGYTSEIFLKIHREPTVKGRKPGFKSMIWNIRKKETVNQDRNKNSKNQE